MKKRFNDDYDFMPETYSYPKDKDIIYNNQMNNISFHNSNNNLIDIKMNNNDNYYSNNNFLRDNYSNNNNLLFNNQALRNNNTINTNNIFNNNKMERSKFGKFGFLYFDVFNKYCISNIFYIYKIMESKKFN